MFTAFADLVAWAIHCQGVRWLLHYLDDFLLFGALGTLEVVSAAVLAMEALANAGIPVAARRSIHSCDFLGYHGGHCPVSTKAPPEKVTRLTTLVEEWSRRCSCTRKEIKSFVGYLHMQLLSFVLGEFF